MKKLTIFLLAIIFTAASGQVFAQPAPTNTPIQQPITPSPTTASQRPTRTPHKSVANCDVCGYCQNIDKVPGNWQNCRKCVYPGLGSEDISAQQQKTLTNSNGEIPTPDPFHHYTGFGCISTQPGEFASQISSFFFSIVGGIAFLFFIYGAGVIATARSDPSRLNQGKRIIYGAIIGLLFSLFSVFIIRFISQGLGLIGIGG